MKVLGSSSNGNCYLLENDTECLIIEVGVNPKEIEIALDFSLKKVVGAIVTHSHGDHAKFVPKLCQMGIKVAMNIDTSVSVYAKSEQNAAHLDNNIKVVEENEVFKFGGFTIQGLRVEHDEDVICFCYRITHKDIGRLLFATDFISMPYVFPKLRTIMIEANYANAIIDENVSNGVIDEWRAYRTKRSHCELQSAIRSIKAQDQSELRNIILLHLSSENSDGYHFETETQKQTGIPTTIARAGVVIEL